MKQDLSKFSGFELLLLVLVRAVVSNVFNSFSTFVICLVRGCSVRSIRFVTAASPATLISLK